MKDDESTAGLSNFQAIGAAVLKASNTVAALSQSITLPLAFASEEVGRSLAAMAQNIASAVEGLQQAIQISLEDIEETIQLVEKTPHKFGMAMISLGWPPHGDLYLDEMVDILEIVQTNPQEHAQILVNDYMTEHFDAPRIISMSNGWKKKGWLARRQPILKETINAHLEGYFNLSVPVMLAQIEGIIVDGRGYIGRVDMKRLRDFLAGTLEGESSFSFDSAIKDFFLTSVLAPFEHGTAIQSTLSRHAILHGGDVEYGTAANSLKCILLFDYLQDKCGVVTIRSNRVYHHLDCRIAVAKRPHWTVFDSTHEAARHGKRPCRICSRTTEQ